MHSVLMAVTASNITPVLIIVWAAAAILTVMFIVGAVIYNDKPEEMFVTGCAFPLLFLGSAILVTVGTIYWHWFS